MPLATIQKPMAISSDCCSPSSFHRCHIKRGWSGRSSRIAWRRDDGLDRLNMPYWRPTAALVLVPFVGVHDVLHQPMTNDIAPFQHYNTKSLDAPQLGEGVGQAAVLLLGQVDLRRVARDDHLPVVAEAGQEHQ